MSTTHLLLQQFFSNPRDIKLCRY